MNHAVPNETWVWTCPLFHGRRKPAESGSGGPAHADGPLAKSPAMNTRDVSALLPSVVLHELVLRGVPWEEHQKPKG
jgi:hypothetical protein